MHNSYRSLELLVSIGFRGSPLLILQRMSYPAMGPIGPRDLIPVPRGFGPSGFHTLSRALGEGPITSVLHHSSYS